MSRELQKKAISEDVLDLIVIGGGVVGAGIAYDAALRGMSLCLLEKADFASGTSSRTSKLIHGGLRYLEQLDFRLVYEAVNERERLQRNARHLVRPIGFYFPFFQGRKPKLNLVRLGLNAYEAMVGFRVKQRHKKYDARETMALIPGIRQEGLVGSLYYYDAQASDARLVWEIVLGATQAGATALNYAKATKIRRDGDIWEVTVEDALDNTETTVRARQVISAAGVWSEQLLKNNFSDKHLSLRPAKGIHLVLPKDRLKLTDVVVMIHPKDGRVTFIIPGRGFTYVGTTDTDYDGPLDEPTIDQEDIDYLMELFDEYFPEENITSSDILGTWCGLRPLVVEEGKSSYETSREHEIREIEPNFFAIDGGKLTTYRAIAEEAVNLALKSLDDVSGYGKCVTKKEPLPGARGIHSDGDLDVLVTRVETRINDKEIAHDLVFRYGALCIDVLQYVEKDAARILPELTYTWGELEYLLRNERVYTLEDLLLRRTEIYYQDPANGTSVLDSIAQKVQDVLGWDDAQREAQVAQYLKRVQVEIAS